MQVNTTSILVSWSPPDPLGDTAGYIISFGNGAGSSNSVIIADSSTDNFLLTGLVMEARYTMSIVATSDHFNSEVVQAEITLRKVLFILALVTSLINPRRTCTARVTVLGLCVCACVCMSVCLSIISNLASRAITRPTNGCSVTWTVNKTRCFLYKC